MFSSHLRQTPWAPLIRFSPYPVTQELGDSCRRRQLAGRAFAGLVDRAFIGSLCYWHVGEVQLSLVIDWTALFVVLPASRPKKQSLLPGDYP
jgi:hypothetical protein